MQTNETGVNIKNHIIYIKLYIYIVQKVINGGWKLTKSMILLREGT